MKEICSKILTFGSDGREIGKAVHLELLNYDFEVIQTGCKAVDCREVEKCQSDVETSALRRVTVLFPASVGLGEPAVVS